MTTKIKETTPGNFDISCSRCNQPIIGSNKYGVFCKNKCFDAENKEAFELFPKMMKLCESMESHFPTSKVSFPPQMVNLKKNF